MLIRAVRWAVTFAAALLWSEFPDGRFLSGAGKCCREHADSFKRVRAARGIRTADEQIQEGRLRSL